LVPVLAEMAAWGRKHLPASKELSVRAQVLEDGGPKLWAEFMAELRNTHLRPSNHQNTSRRRVKSKRVSVTQKLQAAYEKALAKGKKQ
jgi:hypothetical protein